MPCRTKAIERQSRHSRVKQVQLPCRQPCKWPARQKISACNRVGSQGIDKLAQSTTSVPQLWQFTCRCKGTGSKWQQGSAQTQIMTVIIHDNPTSLAAVPPIIFPGKHANPPMACKMLEEVVAIPKEVDNMERYMLFPAGFSSSIDSRQSPI